MSTSPATERLLLLADIRHAVDKVRIRAQQKTVLDEFDTTAYVKIKYAYRLTDADKAALLAENGLTVSYYESECVYCHCGRDYRSDMCTCASTTEYNYCITWTPPKAN